MCLALPAKVVSLEPDAEAIVDLGGVKKRISTALVEDLAIGEWVIVHVGYALTKMSPEEAERTLALIAQTGVQS
jgi:hydrogenase expression/formation protein HypC